ncbi:hypothetical protein C5167_008324 [Papaver somniferum]|uniref:Uncharacterized protein n=1 Tax=Papaver somniferum TaxID=3469 RepID=A0A4Y7JU76_PAPSO|nr:hypothetical protein C5167_008324 [Papaver somniferum]
MVLIWSDSSLASHAFLASTGGGRPMATKASLMRGQSNLWMLCPAQTLPSSRPKILSATSSNLGAVLTAARVIPSTRPDLRLTTDKSVGLISVQ